MTHIIEYIYVCSGCDTAEVTSAVRKTCKQCGHRVEASGTNERITKSTSHHHQSNNQTD